jgi:hypothetical protein
MKLSKTKRVPMGRTLELESSEPYDTLKAQILVQIASALNPPKIIQEDYNISFTIARAVSIPLALQSESDYNFLVKQATKGKSVSIVKIACEQKATQVRESSFHSLVFHQLKSIRPTQIMGGEDKEILQGNIDRNANIQLLQERWPCGKRGCSTYCFINAKEEHVPLSHARMEVWAMAMVSPSFSSIVSS